MYVASASSSVPSAGAASPEIVTAALPGLPIVVLALGPLNASVNCFVPENGVALLTGTAMVFDVESFSAHCSVPLVAV